ncbi:MAG: ABC transporter ATP-binding protein [Peptococcaceae bacterium]|jgi:spermidine/putrescine transport system ATP-binding protein|nr:ABC transporter ATP-binding protein [Peptococcaceae bacterium]
MIRLVDVHKEFDGETVLDRINLSIAKNEFVTLLGPSGCGKTTTLRIIGGFETPTSGDVLFDGQRINDIPAYQRKVNTVFQRYALFPHLNVYENIAFGLRIAKKEAKEIKEKVTSALELVEMRGFEKRLIDSLSGGQQQRVAIARAVVNEPKVLLLDEPLAALDLKLRKEMQIELKNMQKQLGITFVFVTHDQEEALTMSDTVVVMKEGVIQQIGSPISVYNEPLNIFVADFIGESVILEGRYLEHCLVEFAGQKFPCVDTDFTPMELVDVVIRPEDVDISEDPNAGMLKATVTSVVFKGVHYEMLAETEEGLEWMIHSTTMAPPGQAIGMSIKPDNIHLMKKGASG